MKKTVTFTHRGWFGLCPIYTTNPDSGAQEFSIVPRRAWLEPLMFTGEAIAWLLNVFRWLTSDESFGQGGLFLASGKLEKPLTKEVYCDDES